jgi:hypothetical protein
MAVIDFPQQQHKLKRLDEMDWSADLGKPHMDINDPLDSAPPAFRGNVTTFDEGSGGTITGYKEDKINHPTHYKYLGVECIEMTEHMSFCLGNVVKYVYRCNLKGGVEDLKKARWYLEREIARREQGNGDADHYHGC